MHFIYLDVVGQAAYFNVAHITKIFERKDALGNVLGTGVSMVDGSCQWVEERVDSVLQKIRNAA